MRRFAPVLLAVFLAASVHAQDAVAFPNPLGAGPLTVQHDAEAAEFELYDLLGRRLDARGPLAPGMYLWRLRLADGTSTDAQPVTKLVAGPLDVRMVRPFAVASRGPVAQAQAAERDGCRVAAPAFGGFQHEPRRGSALSVGAGLSVTGGGPYASSMTCLGAVGGVGVGFVDASSPYLLGDQFEARFGLVDRDDPTAGIEVPVTIKTPGGTFGDVRVELDASSPRLVEVIDVGPDGAETVVASTTVPAGTPITRRLARVSAPGSSRLELTEFTARGTRMTDQLLDSLVAIRLGFGTDAPGGVTVQINGATVQGDAVAITTPLDRRIMFETFQIETDGPAYVIDDLAVLPVGAGGPPSAAPSALIPAWLRTAAPDGLFSTSGAGTELTVRCARGATCDTYGIRATASFGDLVPSAVASVAPTMPEFVFSGLTTGPGRGFLFGAGGQVDVSMVYVAEEPSGATAEGEVGVSMWTPPSSRSLVIDFQVVAGPAAVTGGQVRYVRDGAVRRQFPLSEGDPVDLGLRVELTDATLSTTPDGSILMVWTDVVRPDSSVEVELTTGPPVSDYLVITMENIARWSLGAARVGSGSPTVFTSAR